MCTERCTDTLTYTHKHTPVLDCVHMSRIRQCCNVVSLDAVVFITKHTCKKINHQVSIYQQMQWSFTVLTLVLALVQSTWMMLTAVAEKVISFTAYMPLVDTSDVIMAT